MFFFSKCGTEENSFINIVGQTSGKGADIQGAHYAKRMLQKISEQPPQPPQPGRQLSVIGGSSASREDLLASEKPK